MNNNLVRLFLVPPHALDPLPDKRLQGRLDSVLRTVGASRQLSVRARMITVVSPTKYQTVDGRPVSLVGLHGKDELLVLGPPDAVERLADGEVPDSTKCTQRVEETTTNAHLWRTDLERLHTALQVLERTSVAPDPDALGVVQQFFRWERPAASNHTVLDQLAAALPSELERTGQTLVWLEQTRAHMASSELIWWYPWSAEWSEVSEKLDSVDALLRSAYEPLRELLFPGESERDKMDRRIANTVVTHAGSVKITKLRKFVKR